MKEEEIDNVLKPFMVVGGSNISNVPQPQLYVSSADFRQIHFDRDEYDFEKYCKVCDKTNSCKYYQNKDEHKNTFIDCIRMKLTKDGTELLK